MAFKMNSPFKIVEDEEEIVNPITGAPASSNWLDLTLARNVSTDERLMKDLITKGYDWATLGSDPNNPNRIFKRVEDISGITGSIRPIRTEDI